MAHCQSCGRELPAGSRQEQIGFCTDCSRRLAADAGVRSLPPSQPVSQPISQPRAAPRALTLMGRAPVSSAIIGVNVLVFVAMALAGVSLVQPSIEQLLRWGANFGPLSLRTEPWRIFSSNYLHIGIIHIALNMWCLWNLGSLAERLFDRWAYISVYTACGLAGSLASLWWHPMVVGAGASGAIFGMAGAMIAVLKLGNLPISKVAISGILRSLVTFAIYNLVFGTVAGIDNAAHIGGLVMGLVLGALLAKNVTAPAETRQSWERIVFGATAVLLIVLFAYIRRTAAL